MYYSNNINEVYKTTTNIYDTNATLIKYLDTRSSEIRKQISLSIVAEIKLYQRYQIKKGNLNLI